jgi:hypothetical protein
LRMARCACCEGLGGGQGGAQTRQAVAKPTRRWEAARHSAAVIVMYTGVTAAAAGPAWLAPRLSAQAFCWRGCCPVFLPCPFVLPPSLSPLFAVPGPLTHTHTHTHTHTPATCHRSYTTPESLQMERLRWVPPLGSRRRMPGAAQPVDCALPRSPYAAPCGRAALPPGFKRSQPLASVCQMAAAQGHPEGGACCRQALLLCN